MGKNGEAEGGKNNNEIHKNDTNKCGERLAHAGKGGDRD